MNVASPDSPTLDIDMGNSRTKWRWRGETGALPSPGLPRLNGPPARVRVATVLRNREQLAEAVRNRFGTEAEFATVAARLGGVACGYRDPARLGVDRWLALVAAWQRARAALVVVGAGTAATVDFVREDGVHEGGYIAPGLVTMRRALNRETADVRPGSPPADVAVDDVARPGTDTESAVCAGTLAMLSAFAQAAVAEFAERCDSSPAVFVTGGDAPLLLRGLGSGCRHEPHLVLDGLAVALP